MASRCLLFVLGAFITAGLCGATPATSVSCYTEATGTVMAETACQSNTQTSAYAAAQALNSILPASNPADYSKISTYQYVNAVGYQAPPPGSLWESSYAQSNVSDNSVLATTGDVREGYLQLAFTGKVIVGPEGRYGGTSLGLSDLKSDVTLPMLVGGCTFDATECGTFPDLIKHYSTLPVLLGTTFDASASGSILLFADQITGGSFGSMSLEYQFRFVEADGVTPVAVVFAPEPGGTWLSVLGWAALAATRLFLK